MDSITQLTLGAAVGEACLGKKIGYRAAAWGAVLGTLPDLDIIVNPLVDGVSQLYFHRSITHSFTFILLASPLFGWAFHTFYKTRDVGWKPWSLFTFWIFLTHVLIDLPTTYGTQIFQPFTNRPFTTDSIFIIDPLFTVPLFIGLLAALILRRKTDLGSKLNIAGLSIAAIYLLWGHAIKSHVHGVYQESFQHQFGYYDELKTVPGGPTTFLWSGYVLKQDTIYQATYSIFDESSDLEFTDIPRNSGLIEPYINDRATTALLWFSRGYYTVERTDTNTIYLYDLRFGRNDFWLSDGDSVEYVWSNELIISDDGKANALKQSIPSFGGRGNNIELFWNRIWGK